MSGRLHAGLVALVLVAVLPGLVMAQSTPLFPVSGELSRVKTDLLAWATALIGVVLAIYAYRRVKSIIR